MTSKKFNKPDAIEIVTDAPAATVEPIVFKDPEAISLI